MPYYKKIITSGSMVEVEVYKSIRRRNLKCIARGLKKAESTDKQKIRNTIQAQRNCQRLICNNFSAGDWYITLTLEQNQSEEDARKTMHNFLRRLAYFCRKAQLPELKYIGCLEKGKKGKRWHGHLVIPRLPVEIIQKIWKKGAGTGRIQFEQLYAAGNYKKLADYIRKDVTGKKRMKQSRNLIPPKVEVKEAGSRDIARFMKGKPPVAPRGYRIIEDECEMYVNDITGTSFRMVYVRGDVIHAERAGDNLPVFCSGAR